MRKNFTVYCERAEMNVMEGGQRDGWMRGGVKMWANKLNDLNICVVLLFMGWNRWCQKWDFLLFLDGENLSKNLIFFFCAQSALVRTHVLVSVFVSVHICVCV